MGQYPASKTLTHVFLVCFVLFSDEGHRLWPKRHSLLFSFWVGIWDNCIYNQYMNTINLPRKFFKVASSLEAHSSTPLACLNLCDFGRAQFCLRSLLLNLINAITCHSNARLTMLAPVLHRKCQSDTVIELISISALQA